MNYNHFALFTEITSYHGSVPVSRIRQPVSVCDHRESGPVSVSCQITAQDDTISGTVRFCFQETLTTPASVSLLVRQQGWKRSNYLLIPGAVYNGNRFRKLDVQYPPFVPEKFRDPAGRETLITDIPRLSRSAMQSEIQLLSGDMTCPLMGFFDKTDGFGCILQTTQDTAAGYTGLFVREDLQTGEAELRICAPGVRENTFYRMTDTQVPSDDTGLLFQAGDVVEIPFSLRYFRCHRVCDLFEQVFLHRYDLEAPAEAPAVVPFSEAFQAIAQRFEEAYYDHNEHFYGLGDRSGHQFWQTGWVGGGMAGYPLLKARLPKVRKHVLETLDFLFSLQNRNGWIAPMYQNGELHGDTLKFFIGKAESDADKNVLLIRKNADALYFILHQLQALRSSGEAAPDLEQKAKKLCDAFVRLWNRHGQLGQFIDIRSEQILIGGSASGAVAGAALVMADRMFGGYLECAQDIVRYYCKNHLEEGLLNGGPGEILQCPDSESAFGLLESCVELCLATGSREWVDNAVKAAHHAASWVMSYDFHFPADSTNRKFAMHSCGTVFANAQNKHSAPGICTLSGVSLLKLYRITRDPAFLRLLAEITTGLMQFVQTRNRLIPTMMDKHPTPGCVCERVQTCDWEGKDAVGEILAPSSVWPEVSALLTCAEIPSIYLDEAHGQLAVFDHLKAELVHRGRVLEVYNPTSYDANADICVEDEAAHSRVLHIFLPAHQTVSVSLECDPEK